MCVQNVGGAIYPSTNEGSLNSLCELPYDDNTYLTYTQHPGYTATALNVTSPYYSAASAALASSSSSQNNVLLPRGETIEKANFNKNQNLFDTIK